MVPDQLLLHMLVSWLAPLPDTPIPAKSASNQHLEPRLSGNISDLDQQADQLNPKTVQANQPSGKVGSKSAPLKVSPLSFSWSRNSQMIISDLPRHAYPNVFLPSCLAASSDFQRIHSDVKRGTSPLISEQTHEQQCECPLINLKDLFWGSCNTSWFESIFWLHELVRGSPLSWCQPAVLWDNRQLFEFVRAVVLWANYLQGKHLLIYWW